MLSLASPARPRAVALVTALAITAHLALIGLPFINFEWAFSDAARYFSVHQPDLLVRYFRVEANTLGIPALAFVIHCLLPFLKIDFCTRLISISGFALLAYALLGINERTGFTLSAPLLIAIVLLNPLVWTFGGRGIADLFPATLALCAVALFWNPADRATTRTLAIILFGVAIVLKYHAVLLLPLVWLEVLTRPGTNRKRAVARLCAISCAIMLLPAIYVVAVRHSLGFWLAPPQFQSKHHLLLSPTFAITNFISYAGYLALLLMPFSLLPLWKHAHSLSGFIRLMAALLLLFALGYAFLLPNGEMSFGPLDRYLNLHIVNGAFTLCAGLFAFCIFDGLQGARANSSSYRYMLCLAAGIVLFIGVLSFTLPGQRYLLFVLPLAYYFVARAMAGRRSMITLAIVLSIALNAFISANQVATGQAAAEMMKQIRDKGYLPLTEPGTLGIQTDDEFPLAYNPPARYTVVLGKAPDGIVVVDKRPFPFAHKAYSLVPIGSSSIGSQ